MMDGAEMTHKAAHITTISSSLKLLLLNQLRYLQATGYEVVGISAPGPAAQALTEAGIRHIPVPLSRRMTPAADFAAFWKLYRVMRQERFTIVHGHTPKGEFLGQMAARLAGVPIVVDTFRGIYYRSDMHPVWRWLFLRAAQSAAACADVVLSQSREAMEMALREGVCPPEKIKYLGNGIDLQRFDRRHISEEEIATLRREFNISPTAQVVGFLGRLVAEKGILELLAAVPKILAQVPQAHFLFVGWTDHDKPDALTAEVAAQQGVAKYCTFAGFRKETPSCYALMDVFVLPSHRESYPRAPMEAAAMGIPCVVTDIPGCREVVESDRNGILVPLGDISALADAIIGLLRDRERAREMGLYARELAISRFDEQRVFEKVVAEYTRLLRIKGFACPQSNPTAVTTVV